MFLQEGVLLDAGLEVFIDMLPRHSADNEQNIFFRIWELFSGEPLQFDVGFSRAPTSVMGASPHIAPVSETNVRSHLDGCGQLSRIHFIHTSGFLMRLSS